MRAINQHSFMRMSLKASQKYAVTLATRICLAQLFERSIFFLFESPSSSLTDVVCVCVYVYASYCTNAPRFLTHVER